MNRERKHRVTLPAGQVCPSCKQPVETVVERHKTMGVYVPLWTAGPCHNPQCDQYEPEAASPGQEETSRRPEEAAPGVRKTAPGETSSRQVPT
ncbi:hypothetical protein N4P33_32765 [Streptomyces sp. 15-116A]|uniref:hypothetical protein n=1 Tax=Streptomyces sp. 15-116A TaxID=2259035 RepID=UPI0021B3CF4A|nr:hypothetical protein [Streptomyces sp. 15-116A]MCT7356877.1 hypothetical protein [Streptomyces sp. 15-116A]